MTEEQLMGYNFIKARIQKVNERLEELELEDGVGAINMDGMPHGTTPGDPTSRIALDRAALHEHLVQLKAELEEKELEIREYISSVDNEEIKLIIEWRYIDLLDWYEIAGRLETVTGKNCDRSTPAKKVKKYLQM